MITGGPGTGKTTTVAKLLALICGENENLPHIALAAPTGKAAAHMARALHRAINGFDAPEAVRRHLLKLEGQTVHRLLKLSPPKMQAAFDHIRPLPFDVLIVDEASMLDTALMLQLLKAVKTGARVILLGDENQLPSVGIGAVLSVLSQKPFWTEKRTKGWPVSFRNTVSASAQIRPCWRKTPPICRSATASATTAASAALPVPPYRAMKGRGHCLTGFRTNWNIRNAVRMLGSKGCTGRTKPIGRR